MFPLIFGSMTPDCDGKTKNDHAREMIHTAEKRGFKPLYVLMDAWYTCVDNLKAIARKKLAVDRRVKMQSFGLTCTRNLYPGGRFGLDCETSPQSLAQSLWFCSGQ